MAWRPISGTVPQYHASGEPASGYYLKGYKAGTTTPISMASDSTGAGLLAKCQLSSDGYPLNGSAAIFVPHFDRSYKLALYTNAADADADNTGSAIWFPANFAFESGGQWLSSDAAIYVSATTYRYENIDRTADLSVGQMVYLQGGADRYARIKSFSFSTHTDVVIENVRDSNNNASTVNVSMTSASLSLQTLGSDGAIVPYYPVTASETGVTNTTFPVGNVKRYGAVGDGVTDDSTAVIAAFASHNKITFESEEAYLLNSAITKAADDVEVDFGNATIINGGVGYLFTFGTTSDTPSYTGLKITGGHFTQSDPATVSNYNYILVASIKDFSISDCIMDNISNGGITVYAGSEDGVIDGVKINGRTNYTTCRGIWLNGSTASDYSSQYVDTSSITRNATVFAVFAVKNVTIVNCTVIVPNYGVYFINTRDCVIDNCHIDASGVGSTRCIALNNYSPRARVTNCTLISDRSCTGVLVTQVSDDVIISDNVFRGSFGGNRAVYVAYLAQALISNNRFSDATTQHIQIDMGGFANVKGNEFFRATKTDDHRAVYLTGIDAAEGGGAIGLTGTVLANSGVIFESNILSKVCIGVRADTSIAASNGNEPSPDIVQMNNNTIMNMNLATTGTEYPVSYQTGTSGNIVNFRMDANTVLPYTAGSRNRINGAGADYLLQSTHANLASFLVEVVAAGGALTATRLAGNNFSLGLSRSGANLLLTPRTQLGAAGASVPILLGISDAGGATLPRTYVVTPSGSNYLVSAYDAAGTIISFATAGVSFNILLGPIASGT